MIKNIVIISNVLLSSSILMSCVNSQRVISTNNQQSQDVVIAKLRLENDRLTQEKFEAESRVQSRLINVSALEQRAKDAATEAVDKVQKIQKEYDALNEEHKKVLEDKKRLEQELAQKDQAVAGKEQSLNAEIERLREKLQWVYRTYNIKRAGNH